MSLLEDYTRFLLSHQAVLLSAVFLFTLAVTAAFIIAVLRLRTLHRLYRAALSRREGENELEKMLVYLGQATQSLTQRVTGLENEMEEVRTRARFYFQRWALERYRAFKDQGGDQSFTLVLLDENGDGVILTSIYGRDESRCFAKEVERGQARQPLSEEEKRALRMAFGKKEARKQEFAATEENL
ncbi:MAG: DUF4446 family protein [Firmicutes bacterium]|nr:DUF4446 family protein [Bacillota bacterium]